MKLRALWGYALAVVERRDLSAQLSGAQTDAQFRQIEKDTCVLRPVGGRAVCD